MVRLFGHTKNGLLLLIVTRTTHGKYTKEKRVGAKQRAEVGRPMRAELKNLRRDLWIRGIWTRSGGVGLNNRLYVIEANGILGKLNYFEENYCLKYKR